MSLHRHAARRDQNESLIFAAFKAAGCAVLPLSAPGAPDAIIFCPATGAHLVEIKSAKGKLRPQQERWRASWTGPQPHTIRDVDSAIKLATGR